MVRKMWNNRNSHSLLVKMQKGTATSENCSVVSYKTIHTPVTLYSNHALVLEGVEDLCTSKSMNKMIAAILFIIAINGKQLSCPSVGKWTNSLCYIQSIEYYSTLKRVSY